jgi:hypothetical protein
VVNLALSLSVLLAGIFLWAGLEKSRNLAPLASTIQALGVPLTVARPISGLLALVETFVATGLIFTPHWVSTKVGIVGLSLAFALAVLVAKWRGELIDCTCFGGMNGRLGLKQVLALAPWLGSAAYLHLVVVEPLAFSTGSIRFCALALTITGIRAIMVWSAWCEARGDRLCAMKMFLWPR